MSSQLGQLKLADLQARGWVTKTPQNSSGIGSGYKILKYDGQIGDMAFSSSIYQKSELEDGRNQINLFSSLDKGNIYLLPSDRVDFTLIEIILPNEICEPSDLKELELPDGLDTTKGLVLSGRAPIWLFGYLIHQAHVFKWVGTFDPRLEVDGVKGAAVVVESHGGDWRAGDIVPVPKQ
ncbi:MAG TPA: CRISPR-associated ring nuclease Crn3/Csx3 [Cyanophyceae cyanobacterium]